MPCSIRFAAPDDAPLIHDFIRALAAYEREPHAVEATPESIRAQLEEETPPFECMIAEMDGEPVGFALYFTTYSTWRGRPGLYLEDLFVPPERRGNGYGFALLERLAQIAVERGCGRLEWAVLDWNDLAIDFYKRLGAQPMAEWTVYRLTGDPLERLGRG